jgi:predicted dehydrogenase
VRRVTGSTTASFPQRTITSEPKYGKVIDVEVATHAVGVLDFAGGGIAAIVSTFDVWAAELPRIEVYGTLGTLSVPDPNTFGGPVRVWLNGEWSDVPLSHGYAENSRGLGLADMAYALRSGRPHRASGDMAYHVLDVMEAVEDASRSGTHIDVESTCEKPAPLPMGLLSGTLDE